MELNRNTLVRWVAMTAERLSPLHDALNRYVMESSKQHTDDTPVKVLGSRGVVKPGQAGCECMCAMTGTAVQRLRRRRGSLTVQIVGAVIRRGIWPGGKVSCRQMRSGVTMRFMSQGGSGRLAAWRMPEKDP